MNGTGGALLRAALRQKLERLSPYVEIARIDHWDKNAVMLLGFGLAALQQPAIAGIATATELFAAFIATCFVASANYVLNELLDAPGDRVHPEKCCRAAAQGLISWRAALVEWLVLVLAGLMVSSGVNHIFGVYLFVFALMGIAYNAPPLRTKDLPFVDVLSEALNTPLRLLLGWSALAPSAQPPVALLLSSWFGFAFLMAVKRYAEYRHLADPMVAAAYRRSFAYYTPERLLVSLLVYAAAASVFAGVFIAHVHLELVLGLPLAAGFFAYYMYQGLLPDSPVRAPERLYRRLGFGAYAVFCLLAFVLLLFASVPAVYDVFGVLAKR